MEVGKSETVIALTSTCSGGAALVGERETDEGDGDIVSEFGGERGVG